MTLHDLVPWNWGKTSVPVNKQNETKTGEDALSRLREDFDRFFDHAGSAFGLSPWRWDPARSLLAESGLTGAFAPSISIHEDSSNWRVEAELPGLSEKEIEVRLERGALVLTGERKNESEGERDGVHYSERSYGRFHRSIPLPEGVKEGEAEAAFKNGVLTATLPKDPAAKPAARRIQVQQSNN